jgi:hypothetical protein
MFIELRLGKISLCLLAFAAGTFGSVSLAQDPSASTSLPVKQIESILRSQGTVENTVLSIDQDRDDLTGRRIDGVLVKPSWELINELYFQPIGGGEAIFNGDVLALESESQPVIAAITRSKHLKMMAFHQHFYDLQPILYFIHFRGVGDPVELAREVASVVAATHTPLPQIPPSNPTSPLDAERLANILHGTAQIASDGVVYVSVPRKDTIYLQGVAVKPETGVEQTINFQPLGGSKAAVAPDYALTASEADPVLERGRYMGWDVGCLYNQETEESPQLFFSHQTKVGDAYELAKEIRYVLDLTDSQ